MADEATVATTSMAYAEMLPVWEMSQALLGGTATMRAANEKYLPRFGAESPENYKNRLDRSVLTNYYKMSTRHFAAKPFSHGLSVADLPSVLDPLIYNADMQSNSLHVFASRVFAEGVTKGMSHVLVDYPEAPAVTETLADERSAGRRPYFVRVAPENLIAAFADIVDGREVLVHVRIREEVTVRDGWGERVLTRIRVLEPGNWRLYELSADERRREVWTLIEEGETSLGFIPLTTFYATRTGFMVADPPLHDIATLNVAHWQSASDQRNILTVARFPVLAATGVDNYSMDAQANEIKIGPFSVLRAGADAKFYYVEHSGAAISAGRQDLEDLREQMAILSAESMLRTRTGNPTATQRALDKSEADSLLEQCVMDLEDTLANALSFAGAWLGASEGDETGVPHLSRDFTRTTAGENDIAELIKLRMSGEISRETLFREMIRRGVLSDDFDIDAEIEATEGDVAAMEIAQIESEEAEEAEEEEEPT